MIIRPRSPAPLPQQLVELTALLKDKANFIKNQKFRISSYDNLPQPPPKNAKAGSFVTMFKSITKRIKSKIKEEKRAAELDKMSESSSTIFGTQISIKNNQCQNGPFLGIDQAKKVKTTASEQRFCSSQVEFSHKQSLNKRKMTSTNYSERICKGSTLTRLTNIDRRVPEPPIKSKTKTEAEVEPSLDQDFIPLGQIHIGNNSYSYLKDVKQSAQAHSYNLSEQEEQPMKQIYDKIFVKFPSHTNGEGQKRGKQRRNIRKLYSSYKISHDQKVEKEENDKRKYNFISNKVIKPCQIEADQTPRKQSLPNGNTLGPWVQQKFY